jgi:hypothetical protein
MSNAIGSVNVTTPNIVLIHAQIFDGIQRLTSEENSLVVKGLDDFNGKKVGYETFPIQPVIKEQVFQMWNELVLEKEKFQHPLWDQAKSIVRRSKEGKVAGLVQDLQQISSSERAALNKT